MSKMPKRCSRYGVGKQIGGSIYFHKEYIDLFPVHIKELSLKVPIYCNIVKVNIKNDHVSFLYSKDFDISHEPSINECYSIDPDGNIKQHKMPIDNPYIYHHKWLFVLDDYSGFNVAESKLRSSKWLAINNINFSKIGRKKYWEENVILILHDKKEIV